MPENIDTKNALFWVFIIGGLSFAAGTIHGGLKATRGFRKLGWLTVPEEAASADS